DVSWKTAVGGVRIFGLKPDRESHVLRHPQRVVTQLISLGGEKPYGFGIERRGGKNRKANLHRNLREEENRADDSILHRPAQTFGAASGGAAAISKAPLSVRKIRGGGAGYSSGQKLVHRVLDRRAFEEIRIERGPHPGRIGEYEI